MDSSETGAFEIDGEAGKTSVAADDISAAASSGRKVRVRNATIAGNLNLSFAAVAGELSFEGCRFEGALQAEHATFARHVLFTATEFLGNVDLQRSTFASVLEFRRCTFEGTCELSGATVGDAFADEESVHKKNFQAWGVTINGLASLSKTHFEDIGLNQAIIARPITLEESVINGTFSAVNSKFEAAVLLMGAKFNGRVVVRLSSIGGLLNAEKMTTKGDLFLFEANTVAGPARFAKCEFGGEVQFSRSVFNDELSLADSKIYKHASFSGIAVSGNFDARKAQFLASRETQATAVHVNQNSFSYAHFHASARFEGTEFADLVYFLWIKFDGLTGFGLGSPEQKEAAQISADVLPTVFRGPADFSSSEFATAAQFGGTVFEDNADFSSTRFRESVFFTGVCKKALRFTRAHFESNVLLGGEYRGQVQFTYATVSGQIVFGVGCRFYHDLSLRFSSIGSLRIVEEEATFGNLTGKLDLLGCTYDSFSSTSPPGVFWKMMSRKLRSQAFLGEPFYQFSRQPYLQYEKLCRSLGQRTLAADVLFEMRSVEGQLIKPTNDPVAWLIDRLTKYVTGYGVRLRYVACWVLLSLVGGFIVFAQPGAVTLKSDQAAGQKMNVVLQEQLAQFKRDPGWSLGYSGQAGLFTLRLFLPFEVPGGRHWEPSERSIFFLSAGSWATLLKCLGWIFVPILAGEFVRALWPRKD